MKISTCISVLLLVLSVLTVNASGVGSYSSDESIVEHIEKTGNVTVNMPDVLQERVGRAKAVEEKVEEKPVVTSPSGKMGGYRIQVFSDNNARTAKAEARSRARNVSAKFPEYATYVVFSSPYWRLRVGNFRTQEEANNAAHMLKEAFPAYSREIRVVRDRITVGE